MVLHCSIITTTHNVSSILQSVFMCLVLKLVKYLTQNQTQISQYSKLIKRDLLYNLTQPNPNNINLVHLEALHLIMKRSHFFNFVQIGNDQTIPYHQWNFIIHYQRKILTVFMMHIIYHKWIFGIVLFGAFYHSKLIIIETFIIYYSR